MKKAFVHKIDDNIQSEKCAQNCYCDYSMYNAHDIFLWVKDKNKT